MLFAISFLYHPYIEGTIVLPDIECIGRSIEYREIILYTILFGLKWTVCETKGLSNPASKRCLSELWTSSSTANHGTDS